MVKLMTTMPIQSFAIILCMIRTKSKIGGDYTLHTLRCMVNKWDNIKANFMDFGIHVLSFSKTLLQALLPDNQFYLGNKYTLLRNDRKWNDADDNNLHPPKKRRGHLYVHQ